MADDAQVKLGLDLESMNKALEQLTQNIQASADRWRNIGLVAFAAWGSKQAFDALRSAISSVTDTMKGFLDAAIDAEVVDKKLEFAVSKAGDALKTNTALLSARAEALSRMSIFDDEAIKSAQTALIQFKIYGDTLERTTQLAIDMASAMGGDVASAAESLARSLSIPERGLQLLRRQGIEVTESQKELIKSLIAAGDKAGAQSQILSILEERYKGAGAAAADTAQGGLKQVSNILGDVSEELGGILLPYLKEAIPILREIAKAFLDWAESFSKLALGNFSTFGPKFKSFLLDAAAWVKTFVDDSLMSIRRLMGELNLTAATAKKFLDITAIGDPDKMRAIAKEIRDANKQIADNTPLTLFQDRVDANRALLEGRVATAATGSIPFVNRPSQLGIDRSKPFEGEGLPGAFADFGTKAARAFAQATRTGSGWARDLLGEGVAAAGGVGRDLLAGGPLREIADRIRASQEASGRERFQSGFEDAGSTFRRIQSAVASTDEIPKKQLTALEKQIIQMDEANEQAVLQNAKADELIRLFNAGVPAVAQ